ncbi:MAG: IS1182 family transposase [Peptostreptococcaceae bacterium]
MKTKNIIPIHQIGFPECNEFIIPDDDSVRLLYDITEELDYTELHKAYSTNGRKSSILPETLFRIIVYGYMEGVYSSRDLEKHCKRDINFRWLLQNQLPPSHNTIARFRSDRLSNSMENLFTQLILKLRELQEIKFENLFIDGTKIEAYANRYTFVWKKSVEKNAAKLQEKVKGILEEINYKFKTNFNIAVDYLVTANDISLAIKILYEILKLRNKNIAKGKGNKKSEEQRYIESLEDILMKKIKYDEYNLTFNGRNSFSKTDHDATFMHMKEDHMKNGQLKPAYNVQIGVEGEYIVGIDISSERSDQLTFIPFLERLEGNIKNKYNSITADAGYESEENYTHLETNNQRAFIKPQTYEKSKTRKFKQDISKRENMIYNENEDYYICASNRKLLFKGTKIKKSKSNYESRISIYESENCLDCKYKADCTKAKGNKQLYVAKNFIRLREESLKNIKTDEGILLRMNRSIQVEGAFGVIKEDHNFRRFLLRGNLKVNIEFLLLSFAYNINKYQNKRLQNRTGKLLHQKHIA